MKTPSPFELRFEAIEAAFDFVGSCWWVPCTFLVQPRRVLPGVVVVFFRRVLDEPMEAAYVALEALHVFLRPKVGLACFTQYFSPRPNRFRVPNGIDSNWQ